MSLRKSALCAALMLAASILVTAQTIPAPPPYPDQGYYGQQPYAVYQSPYWGNAAYQRGYQDGLKDGRKDWQDNHGSRPTGTDKYEDAPGYDKAYGDKNAYKEMYRNGYAYGYQVGYNGNAQAYRAMATSKYQHTPGYDSSYGDKDQYKQSYRQGYAAGYQQGFGGYAAYPPAQYPVYGSAYPPQPPYAAANQGYGIGYQQGLTDGRNDRVSSKAYRATKTDHYEDAHGYNKSFGDKDQYKQFYRQGYVAGYQAGFNGKVR